MTTHADVTGNALLAARARALADAADRQSPERRAALAASVALAETRTVPAARVVLGLLDDVPKIRDAALAVLAQLQERT
jgi:hypothetical protein